MSLEQELRDGAAYLIKLADDLKYGLAREIEVSQNFGHVYEHALQQSLKVGKEFEGTERIEKCVDFLELWGIYFYIATCPRTGIRFVEGTKKRND